MPAKSTKQAIAARIARGIQKGEVKPKAGTASAEMAKMDPSSLKHYTHTEEKMPKLKELVKKVVENIPQNKLTLNGKEVDVSSIELDGVDAKDFPKFSDAYISAAYYVDGALLTDKEVDQLTSENPELVNDLAHNK